MSRSIAHLSVFSVSLFPCFCFCPYSVFFSFLSFSPEFFMDPVSDLVVSCPPEESKTRQEFYHDSLVTTILQRSGVPNGVPFASADVDFDVDLTRAYEATSAAQAAFQSLPVHIVKQFGSFPRLFAAMAAGQVRLADLEAAVSAAEKAAPASDSAPVEPPPCVFVTQGCTYITT